MNNPAPVCDNFRLPIPDSQLPRGMLGFALGVVELGGWKLAGFGLTLTDRTEERRAAKLNAPLDRSRASAPRASTSLVVVDEKPIGAAGTMPVGDRVAKRGFDRIDEGIRARRRQPAARHQGRRASRRRQRGTMQCFRNVDVAEPGDDTLIQ